MFPPVKQEMASPDPIQSSAATSAGNNHTARHDDPMDVDLDLADPTNNNNNNDNDHGDPVIREFDVFLSPALCDQIHLLQFPLQPAGAAVPNNNNNNSNDCWTEARLKPRHHMLELEQPLPDNLPQRHYGVGEPSAAQYMTKRTWKSTTIPVSTHLCLAKFMLTNDDENVKVGKVLSSKKHPSPQLHLVPLQHIFQMRPSMRYIDALDEQEQMEQNNRNSNLNNNNASDDEDNVEKKPLMFKRKESERAAHARLHSFAYKKASEDAEEWQTLELHHKKKSGATTRTRTRDMMMSRHFRDKNAMMDDDDDSDDDDDDDDDSAEYQKALEAVQCPQPQQYCMEPASASIGRDYIGSLNYMSSTKRSSNNSSSSGMDHNSNNMDQRALARRLTALLRPGWPIPYQVIKLHFVNPHVSNNNNTTNNNHNHNTTVTDEALLRALNTCAIMVRGNFCLKTLPACPANIQRVRTFVLLLLQTQGFLRRPKLEAVLLGNNNNGTTTTTTTMIISPDKLQGVLQQVAKRTARGWELRVEDDVAFVTQHAETSQVHLQYWEQQATALDDWLQIYNNSTADNGGV